MQLAHLRSPVGLKRVLNVGGGAARDLPKTYEGWKHDLLDIDPSVKPDICCDALEMGKLEASAYDAVYCSHTLEHFYRHDVPRVLAGFLHVLREDGQAEIIVPNIGSLVRLAANRDLDAIWYDSPGGPISFHDVLYGYGRLIAGGNPHYAHKCGFTKAALGRELFGAGFGRVAIVEDEYNLYSVAFKH